MAVSETSSTQTGSENDDQVEKTIAAENTDNHVVIENLRYRYNYPGYMEAYNFSTHKFIQIQGDFINQLFLYDRFIYVEA